MEGFSRDTPVHYVYILAVKCRFACILIIAVHIVGLNDCTRQHPLLFQTPLQTAVPSQCLIYGPCLFERTLNQMLSLKLKHWLTKDSMRCMLHQHIWTNKLCSYASSRWSQNVLLLLGVSPVQWTTNQS